MSQNQYPKGNFIGLGIVIGIPLGMPIGFAIGNLSLGPAIGIGIGIIIGIALEKKLNPNPIPLSKEVERIKKINLSIFLALGVIAFMAGIIFFLK